MASLRGECSPAAQFSRNSTLRSSTGRMQAKLPGSERFRFHNSTEDLPAAGCEILRTPLARRQSGAAQPASVSEPDGRCTPDPLRKSQLWTPKLSERRRRAKIPISKQTSRVLNNTNVELSAETIEFIQNETSYVNTICKDYIAPVVPVDQRKSETSRQNLHPNLSIHVKGCRKQAVPVACPKIARTQTEMEPGERSGLDGSEPAPVSSPEQNWMNLKNRYGSSGTPSPVQKRPSMENVWVRQDDTQK